MLELEILAAAVRRGRPGTPDRIDGTVYGGHGALHRLSRSSPDGAVAGTPPAAAKVGQSARGPSECRLPTASLPSCVMNPGSLLRSATEDSNAGSAAARPLVTAASDSP